MRKIELQDVIYCTQCGTQLAKVPGSNEKLCPQCRRIFWIDTDEEGNTKLVIETQRRWKR